MTSRALCNVDWADPTEEKADCAEERPDVALQPLSEPQIEMT